MAYVNMMAIGMTVLIIVNVCSSPQGEADAEETNQPVGGPRHLAS